MRQTRKQHDTCSHHVLKNFPMSKHLRSIGGRDAINSGSLKVACDSGEDNSDVELSPIPGAESCLLPKKDISALFRMVLEKLLNEDFDYHEGGALLCSCQFSVHKVRMKKNIRFSNYVRGALKNVRIREVRALFCRILNCQIHDSIVCDHAVYNRNIDKILKLSDAQLEAYFATAVQDHKLHLRLRIIIELRLLTANLIESLILVDRLLFLKEKAQELDREFELSVIPLFDQATSPRNMAIIAIKT